MDNRLEFIQVNLNRSPVAFDLLNNKLKKEGIDLAIISEPPKTIRNDLVLWSKDKGAVLLGNNLRYSFNKLEEGMEYIATRYGNLGIISVYISPNCSLSEFENCWKDIDSVVNRVIRAKGVKDVLVARDFNGFSMRWGSDSRKKRDRIDPRGRSIELWMDINGFICANKRGAITFEGGRGSSSVDVTLLSGGLFSRLSDWYVDKEETLSDHKYTFFDVKTETLLTDATRGTGTGITGWYTDDLKKKRSVILNEFNAELSRLRQLRGEGIAWTDQETEISNSIILICDRTLRRRAGGGRKGKSHVYWWDNEVRDYWVRCNRAARKLSKHKRKKERDLVGFERALFIYRICKKDLK